MNVKNTFSKITIIAAALLLVFCSCTKEEEMAEPDGGSTNMIPVDGGTSVEQLHGYSENIKSRDILFFSYTGADFFVECEKENDALRILSRGGYSAQRDGTYFSLDYKSDDLSFLEILQKIIEDDEIAKDNGFVQRTDGLPEGLGDTIDVKYESGEAIYKSSNQAPTVSFDASQHIYDAFLELAEANGLDFTSAGSNVQLYDDADEEYLQGTWSGTHFGRQFTAEFEGSRVRIYCEGELTDDCEYVIYEGCVREDRLKEGVSEAESEYDYEEFSEISCFRKANDFTITAYFMKDSYSTDRLYKQD